MSIKDILGIIIFFIGILSLVFALSLLIKKNRKTANTLMALLFLCWGIILIRGYIVITGIVLKYPFLFLLHFPVISLIAPLVYLNVQAMLNSNFKMNIRKSMHFIFPFFLLFIEIILLLISPHGYSSVIKRNIMTVFFSSHSSVITGKIITVVIIGCIYHISYEIVIIKNMLTLYLIWELNTKKRILFIIIYTSIIPLTIPQIIFIIGLITGNKIYFLFTPSVLSAVVLFAYFMVQRNTEIPRNLILNIRRKRYERSLLRDVNIEDIHRRLIEFMEVEKVYADEAITLRSLAEKLHITPHQLSEFLNEHFNINFNGFINQYRVKEAMDVLSNDTDLSVMEIAYSVGFNTKSAFNAAFRRFTGTTPIDFRRGKTRS